ELKQPQNELKEFNDKNTQSAKKLWNNKLVNLILLDNYDKCDDSTVAELIIELKLFMHDNVLRNFGLTYDGINYYFVREYTDMDLRDYVYLNQLSSKGTLLSWYDKLILTRQIIEGLRYLHDQDVVPLELGKRICPQKPPMIHLPNVEQERVKNKTNPWEKDKITFLISEELLNVSEIAVAN
ncbi:12569_t:CDS:2, partial [Dentiscutata erythropus]